MVVLVPEVSKAHPISRNSCSPDVCNLTRAVPNCNHLKFFKINFRIPKNPPITPTSFGQFLRKLRLDTKLSQRIWLACWVFHMIQLETGRGIGFCLIAIVKRNWQRFLALMQGHFLNSWWNVFRALASGAKVEGSNPPWRTRLNSIFSIRRLPILEAT